MSRLVDGAEDPLHTGRRDGVLRCASDGRPATWLVAIRYSDDDLGGRLMAYCDPCRTAAGARVGLAMPLRMLDLDPAAVLSLVYRSGATTTDPEIVAEMLRVPPGSWGQSGQQPSAT